ncbi:MAG: hypothetical protein JXR63_01340 [Spirochaetales bacterium]|nr:hypothetical protein [Spirochaetales bacterium]
MSSSNSNLIFFFLIVNFSYAADKTPPTNGVVIGQTCDDSCLYLNIVDLSNNELVIVVYSYNGARGKILEVTRTGIIIDLDKQLQIKSNSN